MTKDMIFYYPRPIVRNGVAGGKIRPFKMLEAFQSIGYEVTVVAGNYDQRISGYSALKNDLKKDRLYDFVYAESANAPLFFTDRAEVIKGKMTFMAYVKAGLIKDIFWDFKFLKYLKSQNIPIGLFYRDLHWLFPHYKEHTRLYRRLVNIPLYYFDLWYYKKLVNFLFLPSEPMKKFLPFSWPNWQIKPLPPGTEIKTTKKNNLRQEPTAYLEILYVGGILPPLYDLKSGVDAIKLASNTHLTLCCRENEWQKTKSYYAPLDARKIKVIHTSGDGLTEYYNNADLFFIGWKPYAYLDFAMPIKLFETLGYTVPIITFSGTETARFVAEHDIGWVINSEEELLNLLAHLYHNRQELTQKKERMKVVRQQHTWQIRAKTVADILTAKNFEC